MQFLPSVTLASVLREGGPLQPDEAAKLGAQISSALAAAHAVGIVHRDVKPGNILITDDGNALISDFGISHALGDATLTATGLVHGTPAFLSPEVARGANSAFASDVFSLGSTLYAALEGAPPFGTDPNTIALLHRVASGEFPAPQRSGPLTPILLDMLAVDPETRPSMEAVATTLNALATGGATVAPELLAPTMPMEPATAETARLDPAPAEPAPPPEPSPPPTPPADDDEDLTPRRPAPVAAAAPSRRCSRGQPPAPLLRPPRPSAPTRSARGRPPRFDQPRRVASPAPLIWVAVRGDRRSGRGLDLVAERAGRPGHDGPAQQLPLGRRAGNARELSAAVSSSEPTPTTVQHADRPPFRPRPRRRLTMTTTSRRRPSSPRRSPPTTRWSPTAETKPGPG